MEAGMAGRRARPRVEGEADKRSPETKARAKLRQAADLGWLDLKREAAKVGTVEIVSGIDQQMRLTHPDGEIKLWRQGDYFGAAVGNVLLGRGFGALQALSVALSYVKKQGVEGTKDEGK
jgi:hypothetical protein